MRKSAAILCLILAVFLGKVVASEGGDFKKGLNAYDRGDYVAALREWTPLAKQGHSEAQHKLGNMYYKGKGVPKNLKTAMDWWKRAAERGNEASQNNLGYMIGSGFGSIGKRRNAVVKVKNNYPVKNVLTITRHGSSASSIWTELILFSTNPAWKKIGVISDPVNKYQATRSKGSESEIVGFYEMDGGFYIDELIVRPGYEMVCNACRMWDVQTLKLIGQKLVRVNLRPFDIESYKRYSGDMKKSEGPDFQKGLNAQKHGNYAAALKEWAPLAAEGNANAQFHLGQMHELGHGVRQNFKTAARWYQASAAQGNVFARHNLGLLHMIGEGVSQDYKTAVDLFTKCAEQGYAPSQQSLGEMYYRGNGVAKNLKTALKWYKLLNENQNPHAAHRIAIIEKELNKSP